MSYLGDRLPRRVQDLLADPDTERTLSAVSVMEVAVKFGIGLLPMSKQDVAEAIADLRLTVIPFTRIHADKLFDLPAHHKDPFDRMLIATALTEDVPVVTSDRRFQEYRGLRVFW